MDKKEKFTFSYSAPTAEERCEIDGIKRQYLPLSEREQKLERLRLLDKRVKRVPLAVAVLVGIIGVLVFGTGLALCLEWGQLVFGCILSAIGAIVAALAYPTHRLITKRIKAAYRREILALCDELSGSDQDESQKPSPLTKL